MTSKVTIRPGPCLRLFKKYYRRFSVSRFNVYGSKCKNSIFGEGEIAVAKSIRIVKITGSQFSLQLIIAERTAIVFVDVNLPVGGGGKSCESCHTRTLKLNSSSTKIIYVFFRRRYQRSG